MDGLVVLRNWLLALLVLTRIAASGYQTYSVERDCGGGSLAVSLGDGESSAALLVATENQFYSLAMDCTITISANDTDHHQIMVSVREIGFRTKNIRDEKSCRDYLQIVTDQPMCDYLFSENEDHLFTSHGSEMTLLYHVSQDGMDNKTLTGHPGFKITATAFTKRAGGECPAPESYHCEENGHCIWSGLTCDSHNNCGNLSDERDCGDGKSGPTTALIILGIIILLLLLIMCTATLICAKNERARNFSNRIRSRTLSYFRRFSK